MNIGIVGVGVVGSACKFAFEKLGHQVFVHDKKLDTKIVDVVKSEVVFVSVPTPANKDGSCDTRIVESVVEDLMDLKYEGVVAIKSTVTPGTTKKLITKYNNDKICFTPEMLRERCAISDMVEHNKLLAVGTENDKVYEIVKQSHGKYPQNHVKLTPTQAELLKYMHNSFNALRIIFANEFYEICKFFNEDYTEMKNAFLHTARVQDIYLDCNKSNRGYGGVCLVKDVKAMRHLVGKNDINSKLFETMDEQNKTFETTVFPGMRFS